MPHERGFWGHAGISFGQSKLDDLNCTPGFACDDKDQAFKLYAGGRFNNIFGLELGAAELRQVHGDGGEADGWGADLALIAGIPIGANSAIFGKLGVIYARTEVAPTSPGSATRQGARLRLALGRRRPGWADARNGRCAPTTIATACVSRGPPRTWRP